MDLNLYLRVLWRFRVIVAIGFVFAGAIAVATVAKVGIAHGSLSISYRHQPTYRSTTRLFVTQAGFPWGRSVLPAASQSPVVPAGSSTSSGLEFADPTRFAGLAVIYAQLINGDLIQRQILKTTPPGDVLSAAAVTDAATSSALPLLDVTSLAHTPAEAARVSQAGAAFFRSYIAEEQASAGIPSNQRVLLQVVSTRETLFEGRKKTLAIVAFLAVMVATLALTFVLENLRPPIKAVAPAVPAARASMRQTGS